MPYPPVGAYWSDESSSWRSPPGSYCVPPDGVGYRPNGPGGHYERLIQQTLPGACSSPLRSLDKPYHYQAEKVFHSQTLLNELFYHYILFYFRYSVVALVRWALSCFQTNLFLSFLAYIFSRSMCLCFFPHTSLHNEISTRRNAIIF